MRLVQDAEIWAAKLDKDSRSESHPLAKGRRAWLQLCQGEVAVGDETLNAGDAAAITDMSRRSKLRATTPSEVLLFDLA